MKMLKIMIAVAVVFGFVASAQAIKVHQRLFLMTNTIEAAQSLGLIETNLNQLTIVSDGTVAIDTDGVMYVNHTGVWQRVSGQGGTINTIVGNDGVSATEVAGTVTLDVDPGDGIIIDGSQNVAVGDGAGIVVNANDVAVGQGDGITVNADDVAVDDTVVRTFGDQNITGIKTFSDINVTNLFAINENVINITVSNMALVATNLSVEGIIDMNGNQITNLAPGVDGLDAVNYTQLTNAAQSGNADLIAATNQLSNDLTIYIDGATNTVLNTANNFTINYVDGATNQTLIDARTYTENYTDGATNALMIEAEDLFVNEAGDNMTGVLGMGGNQITNVAPGTDGMDAVNYSQLTNAIEQDAITDVTGGDAITATKVGSVVDIDLNAGTGLEINLDTVRIAAAAAGDGLTGGGGVALAVDDTVVRTFGDQNITGIKTFSDINVTNLFAINENVINITVSNMALVATNLSVEGIIDMNGNQITNLAPGVDGLDAVNYTQLTNAAQSGNADLIAATNQLSNDLTIYIDGATNTVLNTANNFTINYVDGATNQTLIDARTYTENYTDGATNALMIEAEDLFVNVAGDDMTGILGMGANRITNVADAVNAQDAITKAQLDAATNTLAGDVTLQKAYENGNAITTSAGEGDVTIAGSEQLNVTAAGGVNIDGTLTVGTGATVTGGSLDVNAGNNINVNGGGNVELEAAGSLYVDGAHAGQVNMDGNTGDESIRLNASGKLVIYSGGSLALEFE